MPESLQKPAYFDRICQKTEERWAQLEADKELAGPWHQLFKQVQSPRHILSELLQNADDAHASEARVFIENEAFIFEHNGDDFEEDHFASICRFGYSNKRALHTIGFRGIGFKSTFSLGDIVELHSPTLAIRFEKSRFTHPHWIGNCEEGSTWTRIIVPISNERLKIEAEKNLDEWLKSPVSLLFFRHIRELRIRDKAIRWDSLGSGPVANSEWMALNDAADAPFLLARSTPEEFPDDALDEIRGERLLNDDDELTFPPSRVEIVVGAKGRFYVVLPTGVSTNLPFAVNAPFIQDPARMKIKDPETSPTNRWLLGRIGNLAAVTMNSWLLNKEIGLEERSKAYDLMPDVDREDSSLEGSCATAVELAFEADVKNSPVLLTEDGYLVDSKMALHLPAELSDVWPGNGPSQLLDEQQRPAFSHSVAAENVRKLVRWDWIEQLTTDDFIEALERIHLPTPSDWPKLFALWKYVAPELIGYGAGDPSSVRIFPVKGQKVMYAANEIVRLGERKLTFKRAEDWEFLARYLLLLDNNWTQFLDRHEEITDSNRPDHEEIEDDEGHEVFEILGEVGLKSASDASAILDRVARSYFSGNEIKLTDCVRLAQIAAKFGATISDDFRFVTRDRKIHKAGTQNAILDVNGALEDLIPEHDVEKRLLHQDYTGEFGSCTAEEWNGWVKSGRTKLLTCFPLSRASQSVYGRNKLEKEASKRGHLSRIEYRYKSDNFRIEDTDFSSAYWEHWFSLEEDIPNIWMAIAERIFEQPEDYWRPVLTARVYHVATNGSTSSVVPQGICSNWVTKLAGLPCLPDVQGIPSKPSSLLLRTPATEPLLDIEPFVDRSYDNDTTRQLLTRLGVGTAPTGPGRLLERLRALSSVSNPPFGDLERWYRRLDQLFNTSSTEEMAEIILAFKNEELIRGHDGSWNTLAGVAIALTDDDVPGSVAVLTSVAHLSLWRKIGVAERPTFERALEWLSGLSDETPLNAKDQARVRSLLGRYPAQIIEKTGRWLSLSGHWLSFKSFHYAVSMQTLAKWKHLHDWVKKETANFQMLSVEWVTENPFKSLTPLSKAIEERLTNQIVVDSNNGSSPQWLNTFGKLLRRVDIGSDEEIELVSRIGARMERTIQCHSDELEIVPYVNGVPAGIVRRAEILWFDETLFMSTKSKAKAAKIIPEEISASLREELRSAAAYVFEREDADIEAYMGENFKLSEKSLCDDSTSHSEPQHKDPEDTGHSASVDHDQETENSEDQPIIYDDHDQNIETQPDSIESVPLSGEVGNNSASDEVGNQNVKRENPRRSARRSVLESYANINGFKKDGDDRHFHTDGRWIARTPGMIFPWALHSHEGEVLRYYYDRQHCLEQGPLEIAAEIWGLVDKEPTLYSFILTNPDGAPIELTGTRLRAMKEGFEMSIHPASYRLVYVDDN